MNGRHDASREVGDGHAAFEAAVMMNHCNRSSRFGCARGVQEAILVQSLVLWRQLSQVPHRKADDRLLPRIA